MSIPLCPACGAEDAIVARDMVGTRMCRRCGRRWTPQQELEWMAAGQQGDSIPIEMPFQAYGVLVIDAAGGTIAIATSPTMAAVIADAINRGASRG